MNDRSKELIRRQKQAVRGALLSAGDLMTRDLLTVSPDEPVYGAIDRMVQKSVSSAPVTDADGNLVGLLTEKDCIRALMRAVYDQLPSVNVGDVMSRKLALEESASLVAMASLFLTCEFKRLPVVRDGKAIGMISRRDLLTAAHGVWSTDPDRDPGGLWLSAVGDQAPSKVQPD